MSEKMNRRGFLKGAAMTAAGLLAASCAAPTPVVIEKEVPVEKVVKETVVVEKEVAVEKIVKETVVQEKEIAVEKMVTATPIPGKFNEAPMLAEMVAQGKLPPVEDRVPQEPLVLEPYIEIGTYGGAWEQLHLGAVDRWQNSYKVMERLGKFASDGSIVANVAKSWEFNSDASAITINLRQGMKWSDGKPFTTADVMYWWEDHILNDELSPTKPAAYKVGDKLATFSASDDYTFTIDFGATYGSFVDLLPTQQTWAPAHYLKRFHANYASAAALKQAMEAEGVTSWTDLMGAKTAFADTIELPDLGAWICSGRVDQPIQIWERNAYYWKVDTAGNQLPYWDMIRRHLVPDSEALLLKAIAGDATCESRRIESVANFPVAMANREKGDYRIVFEDNAGTNVGGTVFFNWGHPELGELFAEKDFRVALSVAIDRQEISDIVFKGIAVPSASSVSIGSPWYEPEFGTENPYIVYDPDMANELLDGLGLTERDSDGYRLMSNGERVSMINLVFSSNATLSPGVEVHQLVKEYWKAIGVEEIVTPTERLLWVERTDAGDYEIASNINGFGHKTQTPLHQLSFAPVNAGSQGWGKEWGRWSETDGKEGLEPPEPVKEIQRLYEMAKAEPSEEKRTQYIKDACRIHAEEYYMIGMFNEPDQGRWMLIKNNVGNVPEKIYGSNGLATNFPLFFFKD